MALFRTVFVRSRTSRIDWRASYEITMAGLAATRLFAAAGSGGIALTVWALRRAGLERRAVAAQMVVFMTLLYGVYMVALVLFGVGLRTGLLPGGGGFAITILPAIFGGAVIALVLAFTLLPVDFEGRLAAWAARRNEHGRAARIVARVLTLPALVASGVRGALAVARSRDPLALGALAWWGFDIATLWASFRAFGAAPAFSVVVMAYFVGMLANVLPLPGGIGGVDGGMIGAFIAFGVGTPIAVVAVLVYRAFAFWLPTVPGAIAYIQLRRRVAGGVAGWRPARTRSARPPESDGDARTATQLRVLRPRSPERLAAGTDLHVRVHVLCGLRAGLLRRALPELRWRPRGAPDAPRGEARELAGLDRARHGRHPPCTEDAPAA